MRVHRKQHPWWIVVAPVASSWVSVAVLVATTTLFLSNTIERTVAFSSSSSSSSSSSLSLRRSRPLRRQSTLFYKEDLDAESDDDSNTAESSSSSSSSSWTLEEDWALVDQLPRFTVIGSSGSADSHYSSSSSSPSQASQLSNVCTFWTQLAASTPTLSHRSPDELLRRCRALQHQQQQQQENSNNDPTTTKRSKVLQFGPAPTLLSNWRLDMTSRSIDNRAVGTLDDGRVIWLHYHVVGRLPGDLFSDSSSPSLMALIPGGYLEAVGGRIYELGQPANPAQSTGHTRHSAGFPADGRSGLWSDHLVAGDDRDHHASDSVRYTTNNDDRHNSNHQNLAWWLPATTGTVSAMLASTVLSACIGYGAGLGIVADTTGSHNHHHHPSYYQRDNIMTPTVLPSASSLSGGGGISSSSDVVQMIHFKTSSSYTTPSLDERLAHTQYKILREERLLHKIAQDLERDQANFKGLQQIQLLERQHYQQQIQQQQQQQQGGGLSSQFLP